LLFDELLDDTSVIEHFAQFHKPISIGDCIREFQKEEKLSEYFCERCNKKIEATKSLRIWSTPPILVFHFKRTGNFGRKIDTNIDFLLNNFDVSPFLVPRTIDPDDGNSKTLLQTIQKTITKLHDDVVAGHEQEEKEQKEEAENEATNDQKEIEETREEWPRFAVPSSKQTRYNLFGAVNHYGAAGGGHYIANCLCKDVKSENENENGVDGTSSALKWYLFDDHRVTTVSPLDVTSKNAYLLFYIRSDVQDMFLDQLMRSCDENKEDGDEEKKLFDIDHIDADKHFAFLPEKVRELIGKTLTEEQLKLLQSEGVETRAMSQCECVVL